MSPRLPARSAYSSDVRAYITHVLVSKLGTAPDIAEETAKLWKDGRGAEFYDFPGQAFISLFGKQTGWSLFRIVDEDKIQDWKESIVGMLSSYALFGSITVTVLLFLRILVLYYSKAPFPKGFKKGFFSLSQALLAVGMLMMNYGLQTPSEDALSIGIGGTMIGTIAFFAVCISTLTERAKRERGERNELEVLDGGESQELNILESQEL
ncbi:hypothetical protein NHQ30_008908 [Ciborinia camelliae]|nr:hypothetical protein NHQ30_008908 [Ciborinia camelliae]